MALTYLTHKLDGIRWSAAKHHAKTSGAGLHVLDDTTVKS